MIQNTADQYYNDFVIEQEKTSQPLVVVNWSKFGEVFSLLEFVTWSDFIEVSAGIVSICLMFLLAGLFA